MSKRNRIIYWIATIWLSLGMVSTGVVQLLKNEQELAQFNKLGYPHYLLTLLGIWKILGVIAVLMPTFVIVKEWAYAGFFFAMTGAMFSHMVMGNAFGDIAPSLLLLVLTLVSWYFRPPNRKIVHESSR